MIEFIVPGTPVAQARPRVTRYGTFDPPKSKDYKELVSLYARRAMHGKEPMNGAVMCELLICRAIPKSYTKGKRLAAKHNMILPITKSDIDNYAKGLMDGMTGIIWRDDALVTTLHVKKRFGMRPFVLVRVREDGHENCVYDYEG